MKVIRVVREEDNLSIFHIMSSAIYVFHHCLCRSRAATVSSISRELKIQDRKLSVRNIKNSSRRSKRENRKLKVTGAYKRTSIQAWSYFNRQNSPSTMLRRLAFFSYFKPRDLNPRVDRDFPAQ